MIASMVETRVFFARVRIYYIFVFGRGCEANGDVCGQVCSPSRNSFSTGRRPNSTGVWNFINHVCVHLLVCVVRWRDLSVPRPVNCSSATPSAASRTPCGRWGCPCPGDGPDKWCVRRQTDRQIGRGCIRGTGDEGDGIVIVKRGVMRVVMSVVCG